MVTSVLGKPRILLPVLLLLALGARLWALTRQPIWFDEAVLACFARLSTWEWLTYLGDTVPGFFWIALLKAPLPLVLMRGWTSLFGQGELALRLPALLLGVVALVLLYQVARRMIGQRPALWAALLLALNPFHVYVSQQLSEYGLLLCLGLGSMLLWLSRPEGGGRPWGRAGLNLLALGVHPMGALVPGVQFLLGLRAPRPWRRTTLWLEGVPLALISLYAVLLASRPGEVSLTLGWVQPLGLSSLTELLRQFLHGGLTHGHLALEQPTLLQVLVLVASLALALGGAVSLKRRRSVALVRLLVWALAPPAVVAAASLISGSLWVPRYMIFTLPAWLLLMACGLDALCAGRRIRQGMAALLTVAGLGGCLWLQNTLPRDSFRELAPALRGQLRPDDGVLITPDRVVLPLGYYWDGRLPRWLRHAEAMHRDLPAGATFINSDYHAPLRRLEQEEGLHRWAQGKRRIWVVAVADWPGDSQTGPLLAYLKARRPELSRRMFSYSGAELILLGPVNAQ